MTRARGMKRHPKRVRATEANLEMTKIESLCLGIKVNAKVPRHFELWSPAFQIGWLEQNQKKGKKK